MKQTHTLRIALVVFIVAVLAGVLYFTPRLASPTTKSYTLVVKGNALASGPTLMTVNQGDTVTLHMKSDREGHFMIHGYEKELVVGPSGDASVTFMANQSGMFPIHLHQGGEHIEIARFDIQPR